MAQEIRCPGEDLGLVLHLFVNGKVSLSRLLQQTEKSEIGITTDKILADIGEEIDGGSIDALQEGLSEAIEKRGNSGRDYILTEIRKYGEGLRGLWEFNLRFRVHVLEKCEECKRRYERYLQGIAEEREIPVGGVNRSVLNIGLKREQLAYQSA